MILDEPAAEYVLARRVLLDVLDALGPHRDAVVLVGAQAVYLHTGDADLNVAPMTTDADIALAPDRLLDEPLLEKILLAAGFVAMPDPGSWRGTMGVAVDIMVPAALSPGRRGARLGVHGTRVARRSAGLEPTLVDNVVMEIGPMDGARDRLYSIRVAGPAALTVAKILKIEERRNHAGRRQAKDGLDVLRLLQATETDLLAARLVELAGHPLACDVTRLAIRALEEHGRDPVGPLASMVADAVAGVTDPDTPVASLIALVDDLLRAIRAHR